MQITTTMDLAELNARTQNALSDEGVRTLRDLLNATDYASTDEVPETEWLSLLEQAEQ